MERKQKIRGIYRVNEQGKFVSSQKMLARDYQFGCPLFQRRKFVRKSREIPGMTEFVLSGKWQR